MKLAFGKTLKELRQEKSMTQKQLAEIFNVHQTTIRDWEMRGCEPSYQTLIDIAEYFGVTVGQLLGVEEY